MAPIYGLAATRSMARVIADAVGVEPDQILKTDLMLFDPARARARRSIRRSSRHR